jgi:acetyl-CoA C-acetyltransferase
VILGCVDPVGEAGGDIARAAALVPITAPRAGVQINRFCASGLDAVNFAAAQVMAGQHDMVVGRRRRIHEPRRHGRVRRRLAGRPAIADQVLLHAAGHLRRPHRHEDGFHRDDVRRLRGRVAARAAKAWDEGRFAKCVVPVKDVNGITLLAKDEHYGGRRPTCSRLGQLEGAPCQDGRVGASTRWPTWPPTRCGGVNHVHHAQLVRHR